MIKKRKKAIDNALLKNTTAQGNIGDDNVDIDLRVTVPDNEIDVDFQIESVGSQNDNDDVIFVKYVYPPPEDPEPLLQSRDSLKQRVRK